MDRSASPHHLARAATERLMPAPTSASSRDARACDRPSQSPVRCRRRARTNSRDARGCWVKTRCDAAMHPFLLQWSGRVREKFRVQPDRPSVEAPIIEAQELTKFLTLKKIEHNIL